MTKLSWQALRRLRTEQQSAAFRSADARLVYELAMEVSDAELRGGCLAMAAERQARAARVSQEARDSYQWSMNDG